MKIMEKLTNEDWKNIINKSGGYTGLDNRPVDQFEWQILQAINSGKAFQSNIKYDVVTLGKGFKNGAIEILKDTRREKIFVGAFHVDKLDGNDKLTNITIYRYEYKKDKQTLNNIWKFCEKIVIGNNSDYDYPVEKLNQYIERQLELEGKQLKSKYSKVVEGNSTKELQTFTEIIETIKNISDYDQSIAILRQIFESNEKKDLTQYLLENNLLSEDIKSAIDLRSRTNAVNEFIKMLNEESTESNWQIWFSQNSWLLGTEFVRIVDERRVNVENITDYLVEAYDGFLDIVEIKKPSKNIKFWSETKDHENYFPHSDLIKAITQSLNYIAQVEKEIDSKDFQKRVDNVSVIKPRCTLIFGRSLNWNDEQKEAYRILNSSYHSITILTYDHVLERAKRIIGGEIVWPELTSTNKSDDLDLPF